MYKSGILFMLLTIGVIAFIVNPAVGQDPSKPTMVYLNGYDLMEDTGEIRKNELEKLIVKTHYWLVDGAVKGKVTLTLVRDDKTVFVRVYTDEQVINEFVKNWPLRHGDLILIESEFFDNTDSLLEENKQELQLL